MDDTALFPVIASDVLICLLIAATVSLLVSVAEVAAAFTDKPYRTWKAVVHPWAWLYYSTFALLTFLIGLVLFELAEATPSWAWAIALGLLGPALLKSQVALFKPMTAGEGLDLPMARLIERLQGFLLGEIIDSLATERIERKEALVRYASLNDLIGRLQAIDGAEWQRIESLVRDSEGESTASAKALLVETIERLAPRSLDRLARTRGANPPAPETPAPETPPPRP